MSDHNKPANAIVIIEVKKQKTSSFIMQPNGGHPGGIWIALFTDLATQ